MSPRRVDIAIIGAGSAGISALKLVSEQTDDYLLIDKGELGTTCARMGCMPSKALVEIAAQYRHLQQLSARGVLLNAAPAADTAAVMQEVRRLRDHFSAGMRQQTLKLSEQRFLRGSARLLDATTIDVDGEPVCARAIIVAVGSRPIWPTSLRAVAHRMLDSERFFELTKLPARLGVLGLGSIGLELGQACALLGSEVRGIDLQQRLGCLSDPAAIRHALAELASAQLSLCLGHAPHLQELDQELEVCYADRRERVEQVLASAGRRDNLDRLGMETLLSGRSIDPCTLQLGDLPVFIAGDSAGGQALLHEAIDEGQVAACNALSWPRIQGYRRRVPLQITFTQPQLATVGRRYEELDVHSALMAEVPLATQGRLLLASEEGGVLRLYADRIGKLLGAEMVCPHAEHLAHLIAAWLSAGWSVSDALRQPFYHPTLEEALRSALKQLSRKLGPAQAGQIPLAAVASID